VGDAINKLDHCISNTHDVPPTIEKVDNYHYQNLSDGDRST
jgi:hypothetical protein